MLEKGGRGDIPLSLAAGAGGAGGAGGHSLECGARVRDVREEVMGLAVVTGVMELGREKNKVVVEGDG